MVQLERKVFQANAVLIPDDALPPEGDKDSIVLPEECTLLYIDGDNSDGLIYTKRAWENDEPPSFVRKAGLNKSFVWELDDEGNEAQPLSAGHIELLPETWVVKEDETQYWDEKFRREYSITRIFGVYVFDRMKYHYLCEITPSYERYFLGSQWESRCRSEKKIDRIDELVREGDSYTEEWSYAHVADVEHTIKTHCRRGLLPPRGMSAGYKLDTGMVRTQDAINAARETWITSTL